MKKGDKILIVVVIFFSLTSMFFIKNEFVNYDKKYISVQVDGREIKKIYYDREMLGKEIAIETEFGYNLLEIGEDKVRVIEADCPDKLDLKKGWISKVGENIVCLPNKLIVEIKGSRKTTDVDYISR